MLGISELFMFWGWLIDMDVASIPPDHLRATCWALSLAAFVSIVVVHISFCCILIFDGRFAATTSVFGTLKSIQRNVAATLGDITHPLFIIIASLLSIRALFLSNTSWSIFPESKSACNWERSLIICHLSKIFLVRSVKFLDVEMLNWSLQDSRFFLAPSRFFCDHASRAVGFVVWSLCWSTVSLRPSGQFLHDIYFYLKTITHLLYPIFKKKSKKWSSFYEKVDHNY